MSAMPASHLRWLGLMAFVVAWIALTGAPCVAGSQGTANFVFGGRTLDEEDWGDVHDPSDFTFDLAWGDDRWPVLINVYLANAYSEVDSSGYVIEGVITEVGIGARKVWDVGRLHPYAAGGFVFAGADVDRSGDIVDTNDGGGGLWLGAGAYFRVLERINLGAGLRFTAVDGEIDGRDAKLGGTSFGVILGWAWPASP